MHNLKFFNLYCQEERPLGNVLLMKYLVCLDHTKKSKAVIEALQAYLNPGDVVVLLMVMETPALWSKFIAFDEYMAVQHSLHGVMQGYLRGYAETLANLGVETREIIATGANVFEVICRQVRKRHVDLIVIGVHRSSEPSAFAYQVALNSQFSTLVIKTGDPKKKQKKKRLLDVIRTRIEKRKSL
jgi:nucleotide-binding universal stress UspA family protein